MSIKFPKFRYLFFLLISYLVFAVVTFPASVAYGYWKQYLGGKIPLVITDVTGSVWSAKASGVRIGPQQLESLQWAFHPLSLLVGDVEIEWEIAVDNGYGKGVAGMNVLGTTYLHDTEALIPMTLIAGLADIQALKPGGSIGVSLATVDVADHVIATVSGSVAWHSAEVTLLRPMTLGNLEVKFETDAEGIRGVLADAGGPLQAEGLLSLDQAGSWAFNGALAVRDPQQTDLKNALRSMGRPDSSGKHQIKRSGKLPALL
jgi:hypothetical protein